MTPRRVTVGSVPKIGVRHHRIRLTNGNPQERPIGKETNMKLVPQNYTIDSSYHGKSTEAIKSSLPAK